MAESANRWLRMIEENPGHSEWYIERFRTMAAEGHDLAGEARLVDALAPRRARILDAGCGPRRVGAHLAAAGHDVVGVDLDPALIAAAEADHPGPTWIVGDLSELDLPSRGISDGFDLVVSAGNVMSFLDPATRREVLARLRKHLRDDGRLIVGFGAGRDYEFAEFFDDVAAAELAVDLRAATWELHPFRDESEFLVAVLSTRS